MPRRVPLAASRRVLLSQLWKRGAKAETLGDLLGMSPQQARKLVCALRHKHGTKKFPYRNRHSSLLPRAVEEFARTGEIPDYILKRARRAYYQIAAEKVARRKKARNAKASPPPSDP